MTLVALVVIAFILDVLLGDPRTPAHPVRLIGRWAALLEPALRMVLRTPFWAGVATWLLVVVPAAGLAWGVTWAADDLHPILGVVAAGAVLWVAIAARDLAGHAWAVYAPLARGDLPAARTAVGMLVGRDTDCLDEAGVARAAVESVGENLVDAVTSAVFWALVGGLFAGAPGAAAGAAALRAINTLDATFGYKTEPYRRFGWLSARADDVAHLLPARLSVPAMALAAALLGERWRDCLRLGWCDGRKHASPNSGFGEAAMAGALGVRLGGPTRYGGTWEDHPALGDGGEALTAGHILRSVRLMLATVLVFTFGGLLLALLVTA